MYGSLRGCPPFCSAADLFGSPTFGPPSSLGGPKKIDNTSKTPHHPPMKINRTVQRALQVLNLVANSPKGYRLSELVSELEIPKTSLFDIVSTLTAMNYLREHDKRFFIGIQAKETGDRYGKMQDLCDVAEPILVAASERYNSSVALVRIARDHLDYFYQYHPKDAVMVARQSSPYNIMHASATGKILLAFAPEEQREQLLGEIVLHKFTDRTLSTLEDVRNELKQVEKQGFALDNREYHYLLQCVSAPIIHHDQVIAALSFSGLNLYNDNPQEMIEHVRHTAAEVSEAYARA